MIKQLARQGDVMLVRIDKLPEGLKPVKDNIIAHGEVTGHCHRVPVDSGAAVLEAPNGDKFVDGSKSDFPLVHDEHGPHQYEKGTYQVVRQREYTPAAPVQVRD